MTRRKNANKWTTNYLVSLSIKNALYVTDTHIWCLKDENPNLISRIVTLHNDVNMVCLCCKKATKKDITYEHVIELHPLFNIRWIIIMLFSCVCLVEIYLPWASYSKVKKEFLGIHIMSWSEVSFEEKKVYIRKKFDVRKPALCNRILYIRVQAISSLSSIERGG